MPSEICRFGDDVQTDVPPRVTIDTNCIIDLEQRSQMGSAVARLVSLDRSGRIKLCVPAIMASERRPDGSYMENIGEFFSRLGTLGLDHAEILRPLFYIGIAFYGWGVLSGPELEAQEQAIHKILFPEIEYYYEQYRTSRGVGDSEAHVDHRWRNAKCDVLALWCHIHYGGDVSVTNDGNFHKATKKDRLEKLGARRIAKPDEAARMLGA